MAPLLCYPLTNTCLSNYLRGSSLCRHQFLNSSSTLHLDTTILASYGIDLENVEDLDEAKEEIKRLARSHSKNKKHHKGMMDKLKHLGAEYGKRVDKFQKDCNKLHEENRKAQKIIDDLKASIRQKDKSYREQTQALETLKTKNQHLQRKLDASEADGRRLENECKKLKAKNMMKIESASEESFELDLAKTDYEFKVSDLKANQQIELGQQKKYYDVMIDDMRKRHLQELQEARAAGSKSSKENELQSEIEDLKQTLQQEKEGREEEKSSNDKTTSQLEEQIKQVKSEKSQLLEKHQQQLLQVQNKIEQTSEALFSLKSLRN